MKIIRAYIQGAIWSLKNLKIWVWLYLFNLLFAGLAALPLSNLLSEKIGNSLDAKYLLAGFDYTVFSDFILQYGDAVGVILGQSQLLVLLYLPLSIFLVGGIIFACKTSTEQLDFQSFIKNCAQYFWRFLRLTFYFLLLHSIIAFVFWKLFSLSLSGFDLKQIANETVIYSRGKLFLFIYILVASIFFMWQDYTKIYIAQHAPTTVIKSMVDTFKFILKNFFSYWFLYALNALTFALFFCLYWTFSSDDLNSTSSTILFTLIWGQLFVFLRIGMKVLNLKSGTVLYESNVNLT